jgi:zeaxanthin glucosyltransferase
MARHAVIGCIQERSSFNAGLILARTLRDRGHRVSFMGAARKEYRDHVVRHGFEFRAVGSKALIDLGTAAAAERKPAAAVGRWRAFHRQILADVDAMVRAIGPDVAFLDVLATSPAAAALSEQRIPTIVFHGGMLSARFSTRYPPIWSSLTVPPGDGAGGAAWSLRCLAAWASARGQRRRRLMAKQQAWIPALVEANAAWLVRRRAARNGWRFCWGDWGPQPALPEVVIGHGAFDWPQLRSTRCYLSGGSATRAEYDASWAEGLDPQRKIIYCVTSTMIQPSDVFATGEGPPTIRKSARGMKRFLDTIVAAIAGRPDWQLLVACGPFARAFVAALPDNVRICERLPQTEVLQQAAVMITQAGAGAVREAVSNGVPMLAFPLWTDQFGNAARIVHHGLGERLDVRRATVEGVRAAIDRVIDDTCVRAAVDRMSAECARDAQHEVERFAAFVGDKAGIEI